MKKGTKLGKVEVYNKDTLLTTLEIVLEEEQEFDLIKFIKINKFQVGIVVLSIILLITIITTLIFKKKKKKKKND